MLKSFEKTRCTIKIADIFLPKSIFLLSYHHFTFTFDNDAQGHVCYVGKSLHLPKQSIVSQRW